MNYDVRANENTAIVAIQFGDQTLNCNCFLTSYFRNNYDNTIEILDDDADVTGIFVVSKKHALDMIKALEKAIELGWLE